MARKKKAAKSAKKSVKKSAKKTPKRKAKKKTGSAVASKPTAGRIKKTVAKRRTSRSIRGPASQPFKRSSPEGECSANGDLFTISFRSKALTTQLTDEKVDVRIAVLLAKNACLIAEFGEPGVAGSLDRSLAILQNAGERQLEILEEVEVLIYEF